MYPFDYQIKMDIQIKSKDSMYPLDETHWISNVYTYINRNNQLKEFLSFNWIEMNIYSDYTNQNMKTWNLINGEASSSTLVEDLASHN